MLFYVFFFFKQKTAYEMRISDWSSDVCSSDLAGLIGANGAGKSTLFALLRGELVPDGGDCQLPPDWRIAHMRQEIDRSEEHTSELQSLMRISYAVFCLKKKTKINDTLHNIPTRDRSTIDTLSCPKRKNK